MVKPCNFICDPPKFHIVKVEERVQNDISAVGSVFFHHGIFFVREHARLLQNAVGSCNFSDIVKRRSTAYIRHIVPAHNAAIALVLAHFIKHKLNISLGALDMSARVVVPAFDKGRKAVYHFIVVHSDLSYGRIFKVDVDAEHKHHREYRRQQNLGKNQLNNEDNACDRNERKRSEYLILGQKTVP